MTDLPPDAYVKHPHTEHNGAIFVVVVPVAPDSPMSRVYRIYEEGEGHRATWQMNILVSDGERAEYKAALPEQPLGSAHWNGRSWVAEKDPPDVENHLKSMAHYTRVTPDQMQRIKEEADAFINSLSEKPGDE